MRGLCRRGVDMIAYYSGFSDEMQGVGWGFLAGALWKTLAGSKEDSVKGTMVPFAFNQPAAATVSGPVEGPKRLFLCKKGQDTHCVSCPLAQRKGFEPLNAFNTLHDFQSCAFDQLSHLCTASLLNSKNYYNRGRGKSQEKKRNIPAKSMSQHSAPGRCAVPIEGACFKKIPVLDKMVIPLRRKPCYNGAQIHGIAAAGGSVGR